jgi:hypothetical protein
MGINFERKNGKPGVGALEDNAIDGPD